MSKPFATATRFARTFSTSSASRLSQNLPRAAAATSTSTVSSRPASDVAKTPQRRTVYARVAKPAGTTSTYRRTPVKPAAAAAPTPRNAVESSEPVMPDLDALDAEEASFPDPQPVAELPDYARLAPPIDHSGAPARRTEPALPSPVLSEHPVHTGRNAEVGEDWTTSFYGLSAKPFPKDVANVLLRPLAPTDIEIKPGESSHIFTWLWSTTLNTSCLSCCRRTHLLARDQVQANSERSVWTGRLGHGPSWRNHRRPENCQQRMGSCLSWPVSSV